MCCERMISSRNRDGRPFPPTPWRRETLASLLAKKNNGCFNASEIKPWVTVICQTLDDAHRAGLLHRDLVPRNILLTNSGEILIANFGISRIILDAMGRIAGGGKRTSTSLP